MTRYDAVYEWRDGPGLWREYAPRAQGSVATDKACRALRDELRADGKHAVLGSLSIGPPEGPPREF